MRKAVTALRCLSVAGVYCAKMKIRKKKKKEEEFVLFFFPASNFHCEWANQRHIPSKC